MDVLVGARAVGAARLGESDCELLGDTWLAQPVNALTSLAFVGVAVGILSATTRAPVDRVRSTILAVCLASIGVGSFLYHGPQPNASQELHDLPIVLTATVVAIGNLRLVTGRPRHDLLWLALAAVAFGSVTIVDVRALPVATGIVAGAAVALEILVARRRLRPVQGGRRVTGYATIVAVAAVAAAAWPLGHTDSPWCDPDGLLQLHGLWHLASATLLALWWRLAFWRPVTAPTSPEVRW